MIAYIHKHFQSHLQRNPLDFILCVWLEMHLMSWILFAVNKYFDIFRITPFVTPGNFEIIAIFYAPVIETLFTQFLPIYIMWKCNVKNELIILTSALLFAGLHLMNGAASALMVLPGAVYLGFACLAGLKRYGKLAAFLFPAIVHAIHNMMTIAVVKIALIIL